VGPGETGWRKINSMKCRRKNKASQIWVAGKRDNHDATKGMMNSATKSHDMAQKKFQFARTRKNRTDSLPLGHPALCWSHH
jgi:hypothetical protein